MPLAPRRPRQSFRSRQGHHPADPHSLQRRAGSHVLLLRRGQLSHDVPLVGATGPRFGERTLRCRSAPTRLATPVLASQRMRVRAHPRCRVGAHGLRRLARDVGCPSTREHERHAVDPCGRAPQAQLVSKCPRARAARDVTIALAECLAAPPRTRRGGCLTRTATPRSHPKAASPHPGAVRYALAQY